MKPAKPDYRIVKEVYDSFVRWYIEKRIVLKFFWMKVDLGYTRVQECSSETDALESLEELFPDSSFYEYRSINFKQNNIL